MTITSGCQYLFNMNIVQEYKKQKNYNKINRMTVEPKQYTVSQSYTVIFC